MFRCTEIANGCHKEVTYTKTFPQHIQDRLLKQDTYRRRLESYPTGSHPK